MMGGKAMIRKGLWLKTISLSACERKYVCLQLIIYVVVSVRSSRNNHYN